MTVPTKKLRFQAHTPVDPKKVDPKHCGRLQLREVKLAPGVDPEKVGSMEYYFPADTVIEVPDYSAVTDEVHRDTPEFSPTPETHPQKKTKFLNAPNQPETPQEGNV